MFPHQLTSTVLIDFFEEKDAPALCQLINKNRAYLKEFLPWLDFSKSVEDSHEFIRKTTIENNENKALTLCLREAEQIIGVICFHAFDRVNNCAGIGYWLDNASQGRGIITLACDYLIQYGFSHLNLTEIKISCATANIKSTAVPERLGFSRIVTIPQKEWLYDHFVDHFCYKITAEEWSALKNITTVALARN